MPGDRRRPLRRCAVVALAAAGLTAGAPAAVAQTGDGGSQPRPLIVVSGRTVVLAVDSTQATERIAVRTAQGVPAAKILLGIARARRGGSRRADYAGAFGVRFSSIRKTRPDALLLTVDTRHLSRPGAYDVVLRAATRRQRRVTEVALKVIVSPARLVVPATIAIERTLPVSGDVRVDGAPTLRDRSRRTWIPSLRATVVGGPTQDGKAAEGQVGFATTTFSPGGRDVLDVEDSDLPVGTATGIVELDGPELERPVRVPFTVVTKRDDVVIVLLILLGLVAGTVGRTLLGDVLRRTHTRATARGLDQTLEAEITREPDSTLKAALQEARSKLTLGGLHGPATIATANAAAATARDEAYKKFLKRYEATRTRLDALRAEVVRRGRVQDINARYVAAQTELQAAGDALDVRNVKAAERALGETELLLSRGVEDGARTWATAVTDLLGTLTGVSLTAAIRDRQAGADAITKALETVRAAVDGTAAPEARAAGVLQRADEVQPLVDLYVGAALNAARSYARTMRQRLADIDDPQAAADLHVIDTAVAALRNDAGDRAKAVAALDRAVSTLDQKLSRIVEQQRLLKADETPANLGETAEPAAAAAAAATPRLPERAPVAAATAVGAVGALDAQQRFEAPSVAGWATLLVVGVLRFVILAIVLSLVGYYIFRDGFVGTTSEMINIFVWAFFTNVVLGGVETLAGRLPGLPAAPAAAAGGGGAAANP
ncbi:MAG TPA: hypothetical protein VK501_01550 [Baekduia sp.]|uniref:hypothetical protein n=1 Tax=Baekduia sp. TaxID=2600305 RepID=UPI002C53F982|nr:hypothetical protein [Baekduia sp.]HMJ32573.1 hypothetical protein [Baekduia sp.]